MAFCELTMRQILSNTKIHNLSMIPYIGCSGGCGVSYHRQLSKAIVYCTWKVFKHAHKVNKHPEKAGSPCFLQANKKKEEKKLYEPSSYSSFCTVCQFLFKHSFTRGVRVKSTCTYIATIVLIQTNNQPVLPRFHVTS